MMMKKNITLFMGFVFCCSFSQAIETVFVHEKKKSNEKPSALKQEMVDSLKKSLTDSSDMIVSIAQMQPEIVKLIESIAQDQGECAQETVCTLKKRRDFYQKIEQDLQKLAEQLEEKLTILKQHTQKGA